MKILVTGGSGFVGTHLISALDRLGHHVTSLDLKPPSHPLPRVNYVLGDVCDSQVRRDLVQDIDAVFHLAAIVSVPLCELKPKESEKTNFHSTLGLIEDLARNQPVQPKRLYFSSSAAVYGESKEGLALLESMASQDPPSLYANQKLRSEQAIASASKSKRIAGLSFRFFNIMGEGQNPDSPYSGVLTIFAARAGSGSPLTLNGDGGQTRDFISVDDVVRACTQALELPTEALDGKAINLGTGQGRTLNQVIELIGATLGTRQVVKHMPARERDIRFSVARIERAETLLKWRPEKVFEEEFRKLLRKSKQIT